MTAHVVWMDRDQARIFSVEPAGNKLEVVWRKEVKHHTNSDPENHKDTHWFFQDIAEAIQSGKEIFLLGPGLAKEHFHVFLGQHHRHTLFERVVGMDTVDHPSDNQILEASRKFFRRYDAFANPVS